MQELLYIEEKPAKATDWLSNVTQYSYDSKGNLKDYLQLDRFQWLEDNTTPSQLISS